jgi:hypothetical protein
MSILNQYTNPNKSGSFAGLSGFVKNNLNFKEKDAKNSLLQEKSYTQHVLPRKFFKRNKVIVGGIDHLWQADLIDVKKLKYFNKNFNYILTVIDVFSKFGWAVPLKFKKAEDTYNAFKFIIESSKRKPRKLHIDAGREFYGKCKQYLQSLGIQLYIVESELKASVVERFNRTLKEKMWRLFTFRNKKIYYDYLPQLVNNYNNSYHRSIKNKPINITHANESKTFEILNGFKKERGSTDDYIHFKFNKGDYVRVVLKRKTFDKAYTKNWTEEIYIITERIPRNPPVYKIKSLYNENLTKSFNHQQLQLVSPIIFPIDSYEVLDQTDKEILVLKINYEETKPLWVNKSEFLAE